MLNNKAVQKESILKPPTILSQIIIISALITNKNKPKEKIVIGSVNKIKIGFMKILSKPRTIATQNAVKKPSISIPEIRYGIKRTKAVVTRILVSNFKS